MAEHGTKHRTAQHAPASQSGAETAGPRQARMTALADSLNTASPVRRAAGETGLPPRLKAGVETLSGMAMDHVKVHYNSARPAQMRALAYAQGADIHVAPGQERHLPHEAWHVVQQAQGRVRPTAQLKQAVPINDDKHLEREADVMGAKAMSLPAQRVPAGKKKKPGA